MHFYVTESHVCDSIAYFHDLGKKELDHVRPWNTLFIVKLHNPGYVGNLFLYLRFHFLIMRVSKPNNLVSTLN